MSISVRWECNTERWASWMHVSALVFNRNCGWNLDLIQTARAKTWDSFTDAVSVTDKFKPNKPGENEYESIFVESLKLSTIMNVNILKCVLFIQFQRLRNCLKLINTWTFILLYSWENIVWLQALTVSGQPLFIQYFTNVGPKCLISLQFLGFILNCYILINWLMYFLFYTKQCWMI